MKPQRRAKLIDVARDAGVSPATVSRAISQPYLLSKDTLVRVRDSAERLGYRPDAAAQALASGRSMTIGVVIPTLDNAIFSRALQSMQRTLASEGYQLLVASHDYSAAAETDAVRTFLARGLDGLMLVGGERAPDTRTLLENAGVPVVLTWCDVAGHACVAVDNDLAGRLAAKHLYDLGHRRIGMVTGGLTFNDRQQARLEGARRFLSEVGIDLPDWLVSQQPTTLAGGRIGCARMLELANPPTALIGGIDLIAIGCVVEAQGRGLHVPTDLSVVGIDNLDMSAHLAPSLTTVHIPTADIGSEAAKMLVGIIRQHSSPRTVSLPVDLVVRRSSGLAPAR